MQNYNIETDDTGKEIVEHGDAWFPLAGYDELFSEFVLKEVPWHWHDEIELIIVCDGSTLVECIGKNIKLVQGDGIFINSNVMHRLTQIGEQDCRIINFVLKPELIGGRFDSKIYREYILPICSNKSIYYQKFSPSINWQSNAIHEIEEAFSAYTSKSFGYEMIVRSKLTSFWYLMCINQKKLFVNNDSLTEDEKRIKKIIRFIQDNYSDKILIKSLARSADISESECYRLFNRVLKCTPNDYILNLRLQIAVQKLIDTDMNILNLAIELGFGSSSYFSKKFREQYSYSPSEFRAVHQ